MAQGRSSQVENKDLMNNSMKHTKAMPPYWKSYHQGDKTSTHTHCKSHLVICMTATKQGTNHFFYRGRNGGFQRCATLTSENRIIRIPPPETKIK